MTSVLAAVAIVYGVAAALSVLLQARQMLSRGGSCGVSARFLAAYVGGYAIWLLYGLALRNVPITVVDALGLVCGAITLTVALSLRGSLLSPASWNRCNSRDPRRRPSEHAGDRPDRLSRRRSWRAPTRGHEFGEEVRAGHSRRPSDALEPSTPSL